MDYFGEAIAWGQEQDENSYENYENEWRRFVQQQRSIWSPTSIFDLCCVKWLVFGSESPYDDDEWDWNDGNIVGRGCNYCERIHPYIELSLAQKGGGGRR